MIKPVGDVHTKYLVLIIKMGKAKGQILEGQIGYLLDPFGLIDAKSRL